MAFGQLVTNNPSRDPAGQSNTFGMAAGRCYVKITINSEGFIEAKRTEVSPGPPPQCEVELEADITVRFECVCEATSDAKTKFSWQSDSPDTRCRTTGNHHAHYGNFKIILYTPAAGSCPPGTCVGSAPPFHRTYRDTIQVGCGGTVCTTISGARMQKKITQSLENQLRAAYGGKTIKCPKKDDEFFSFDDDDHFSIDNMPSLSPRPPK